MPVVLNPGFENNLANWALTDGDASVTWTRDTSITDAGSDGSSKLVNTVAGADDFIEQVLALTPGHDYFVSARLNVTAFTAAAILNRGLFVVSFPVNSIVMSDDITAVTSGWVTKTLGFNAGSETSMSLRLYAAQATAYWDNVEFVDPSEVSDETIVMPYSRTSGPVGPF